MTNMANMANKTSKTIKIQATLSIGLVSCEHHDVLNVEVDDTDTEEQVEEKLQQALNDWSWEYIETNYTIISKA